MSSNIRVALAAAAAALIGLAALRKKPSKDPELDGSWKPAKTS